MGEVIFWGIVIILLAFALGVFVDTLMDTNDESVVALAFFVTGTFLLMLGVMGFTLANQKYFEKKEYSVTEYHLNKKIVTVDENNTVKVDTLYSFEKRN